MPETSNLHSQCLPLVLATYTLRHASLVTPALRAIPTPPMPPRSANHTRTNLLAIAIVFHDYCAGCACTAACLPALLTSQINKFSGSKATLSYYWVVLFLPQGSNPLLVSAWPYHTN